MAAYANVIIPMVEKFFSVEYARMRALRAYVYIAGGQVARIGCVDSVGSHLVDSSAYEYCPVDRKIYLGQDTLWLLYHGAGDAAPVVGLAHEWGHNVQDAVGVPEPRTSGAKVRYENQADCVSGAWLRFADRRGWLEPEDVGSVRRYLRLIASAESASRDHGDLAERAAALRRGVGRGLSSCNRYYPRTPLIRSR